MKRFLLARSCCTTPSAMWLWSVAFGVFLGTGLLLGRIWPALRQYGDTMILIALAGACVVNFGRNRTLHCGLTAPLFAVAALAVFSIEAGLWNVDQALVWEVVVAGVVIAFLIEWRTVGRQGHGSRR
jgi:hypothetical protein